MFEKTLHWKPYQIGARRQWLCYHDAESVYLKKRPYFSSKTRAIVIRQGREVMSHGESAAHASPIIFSISSYGFRDEPPKDYIYIDNTLYLCAPGKSAHAVRNIPSELYGAFLDAGIAGEKQESRVL